MLTPVTGPRRRAGDASRLRQVAFSLLALAVVLVGVGVGYWLVGRKPVPAEPPTHVTPLTGPPAASLYGDAFNEAVFMRPGQYLTRALVYFDNRGVDGASTASPPASAALSARLRAAQTGFVRSYALSMFGGAFAILLALVLVRVG